MESYFNKDGNGEKAKSYESERLASQFLGVKLKKSAAGERVKQSAKMVYVGFSRSTELLCVAIHKDRFRSHLSKINRAEWEVNDVATNL